MHSFPIGDFLRELDRAISKNSDEKIILVRNYTGVPDDLQSKDIDIQIDGQMIDAWVAALHDAAKELDCTCLLRTRSYYHVGLEIVRNGVTSTSLLVDLDHRFSWRGVDFFEFQMLRKNVELYSHPIYIPRDKYMEAIICFHMSFLFGGFVNEKYLSLFRSSLQQEQDFFDNLVRVFGPKDASYLRSKIESADPFVSRRRANRIRLSAIARALSRAPVKTLGGLTTSLYSVSE